MTNSPISFWTKLLTKAIPGFNAKEATDENPERVAAVQRLTWAYLRSALYPEDPAWPAACAALTERPNPLGRVECK